MTNFNQKLSDILKKDLRFIDQDGDLLKSEVIDKAWKVDPKLIELLLEDKEVKQKFFSEVKEHWVFNVAQFVEFVQDKNFLNDSYTKFKNKIGLMIDGKYLNQRGEVALAWPYKDCVLEGGMSDEESGKDEIFFNEVLAQDEIDRLLDAKVLTNGKWFSKNGEEKFDGFTRDEGGLIKDNLIIKGNNLLALHSLKKEFSGKVKLVYIDPPYNTGNDGFRYNDRFNHSTWLTFMKNRLEVAKELMKESGVIFVSLDDKEAHYCKVLMDEVFGEENFLSDIIWNSTKSVTNTAIISNSHTHQLVYFRSKDYFVKNRQEFRLEEDGDGFSSPDNDPRGVWKADPFQVGGWRPNQQYEITNPNTGKVYKPNEGCSWKNDYKKFQELIADNRIVFGSDGKSAPQRKRFLSEAEERGKVSKTLWTDLETTTNGTQHLKKMFGKAVFNNPKPEGFIKRILELATSKGDIVLDYHLGSGTTATTAHKMERQYIGVEQMDYVNDVTIPRLQKVVDGEQGGISEVVEWKGGGSFIYFELKKHNEKFIDKIQVAKTTADLEKIWEEMKAKSFLNWNVDFRNADLAFEDWKQLDLEKQKHALIELLNKNQLYVNLSEINDKTFPCTEEEKKLSSEFYNLS
jgi:adenine-specific DNA-methyltransferase